MKSGSVFLYSVTLLLGVCCQVVIAASQDGFGAFRNIRTKVVRVPFYRNGQLEFYLRSAEAALQGKQLNAVHPVIDIVRKGVSVETVANSDSSSRIYPLASPVDKVNAYWSKRAYSEGVLISENASLDQTSKIISSNRKVSLRTPVMDLDGVGFSADIVRKVITVNSRVEIVLRNDGSHSLGTPLDAASSKKNSGKITVTRVYGDELIYNLDQEKILLNGNVKVVDQSGTITADKLELRFVGNQKKRSGNMIDSRNISDSGKKLQSARFTGRVYAERTLDEATAAAGKQYARSDMIFYDLQNDMLEMTGSRPRLGRGSDFAEAERIVIKPDKKLICFYDKCFFSVRRDGALPDAPPEEVRSDYADWDYPADKVQLLGNVKVKSRTDQTDMQSDKLLITLADDPNAVKKEKKRNAEINTLTGDNSSKRIKEVIASGKVKFDRNNKGIMESARAGRITYNALSEEVIFEQQPVLKRGGDLIRGSKLTYFIPAERMMVAGGSYIVISAETAGSGDNFAALGGNKKNSGKENKKDAAGPVTVQSNAADLNYGGNMICFAGNVRVRGRGMELDSNTLDIYLKDIPLAGGKKAKHDNVDDLAGRKQPVRALAIGKVRAEDASGILRSGMLDVYFGDKVNPGKVEIEKIIADHNMHVVNKPRADGAKGSSGPLPELSGDGKSSITARRGVIDLLKNETLFYDNVKVRDSEIALDCGHLKIVAKRIASAVPSLESYEAEDEFPDRLAVGEDRELVRIVAEKDVRMRRTLPSGEVQRAKSDLAVYTVKDRKIVLTSKPPRRPQAVADGNGMTGDKVTIDLDEEEIIVDNGDVLAKMDGMDF